MSQLLKLCSDDVKTNVMKGLTKKDKQDLEREELKEYISVPAPKDILKEIAEQEKDRHITVMTPHRRITQVVPWTGQTNVFACLEEVPVEDHDSK